MKDILIKKLGILDFAIGSPRETLQQAFTNKLIQDDRWLQMLRLRNRLAHDYDGSYAAASFSEIIDVYYPLFVQFKEEGRPQVLPFLTFLLLLHFSAQELMAVGSCFLLFFISGCQEDPVAGNYRSDILIIVGWIVIISEKLSILCHNLQALALFSVILTVVSGGIKICDHIGITIHHSDTKRIFHDLFRFICQFFFRSIGIDGYTPKSCCVIFLHRNKHFRCTDIQKEFLAVFRQSQTFISIFCLAASGGYGYNALVTAFLAVAFVTTVLTAECVSAAQLFPV